MHRLWVRITLSFLILLSSVFLIAGFFLADILKNTYLELKEEHLHQTAAVILKAIEIDESNRDLQERIKDLSMPMDARITLIDLDGNVLADSEDDPKKMGNHANRPEVKQIMAENKKSGLSVRYSKTLGFRMMYTTIPIYEDGEISGVMRTSLVLKNIDSAINKLWISIIFVLVAAILLSTIIGTRIAKGISRPVEEMIVVTDKLKNSDYHARATSNPKGELGQLTQSINVLASSLKTQMEKIEENEQQLTGVLANMMSGVLLVNTEGRILLANRAIGHLLGEESENFTGKLHLEVGRSVELSTLIEECLKNGVEIREEVRIFFPKERILDAHLAPYVDDLGETKGIVAVLHDVSDIRRLEKMRSEFVANVSHELKTPVTSVKGFAETLLDGALEDEEILRSFLTIIYDESERLHRLINDILDLSSIEQLQIPLKVENINLTKAVYGTVETVIETAIKKKVKIKLPKKKDVWIQGEKDRIQQIILNLTSNAIAYTPENGQISIGITEGKTDVELQIADSGIGINQSDLPRIFERFYRVDKARSRVSGGTGLGLAIVKHLVDAHRGTIEVNSVEGEGTIFIISLPKKQA
ncbi:two-component system histidine kinase PnpS [Lederbergia lenta]|uniref:histidine kinase n=1 Tax=Lederbergia lenta TaxID=1467 RepID=A0A2X4WVY6_LEDLE|nr:ATP-binding protein [Lederbergia lenta]MEC2322811.1 ATP-binding protein [Lederbergia lenta]SQI61880.1 PAS/PAC sensor signal transduction histidine kinase [Lederbergia lenta]